MTKNISKILSPMLVVLVLFSSIVSAATFNVDYSIKNGNPYEQQQVSGLVGTLQSILPQTIIDGQECSVNPDITGKVENNDQIVFPITSFPKAIVLYKYNQGEPWKLLTSIESPAGEDHTIQLDSDVKYAYEIYLCQKPVSSTCNPSNWELESCVNKEDGTARLKRTVQDSCTPISDFPKETTAFRSECYEPTLNPESDGNFCVNANKNGCVNKGGALSSFYGAFFKEEYLKEIWNECFETEQLCKDYVKETYSVSNPGLDQTIPSDALEKTQEEVDKETASTKRSYTKSEMLKLSKSSLSEGACLKSSQCQSRGEGFTEPSCANPEQIDKDIDLSWSDDLISFFRGSGICFVEDLNAPKEGILESVGNFIHNEVGLFKGTDSKTTGIIGMGILFMVLVIFGGRR